MHTYKSFHGWRMREEWVMSHVSMHHNTYGWAVSHTHTHTRTHLVYPACGNWNRATVEILKKSAPQSFNIVHLSLQVEFSAYLPAAWRNLRTRSARVRMSHVPHMINIPWKHNHTHTQKHTHTHTHTCITLFRATSHRSTFVYFQNCFAVPSKND